MVVKGNINNLFLFDIERPIKGTVTARFNYKHIRLSGFFSLFSSKNLSYFLIIPFPSFDLGGCYFCFTFIDIVESLVIIEVLRLVYYASLMLLNELQKIRDQLQCYDILKISFPDSNF